MHICLDLVQGFGVSWHSSTSTHLLLVPSSKPRGQLGRGPAGVNDVGVVVVVIVAILIVVVIGDVFGCGIGIRGMRSQRYEPRVFLHWYPDPQSWLPRTHSSSSSQISVAALRV